MASWTAESVQEYSLVACYSYLSSVSLNPPVIAVCSGVPAGEQALVWGLDNQTDHEKPWTWHKQLWTLQITEWEAESCYSERCLDFPGG